MDDDGWTALIFLVVLCSIPGYVWKWIFITIVVIFVVAIVVAIVKLVSVFKERRMTSQQIPNAWEAREGNYPRSLESPVDAQIIKVQTLEPTFGTSLDQARRNYWLPAEKSDGVLGVKNLLMKRMTAKMQMETDQQLAKIEQNLRHEMVMLVAEHRAIEQTYEFDLELKMAVESLQKFITELGVIIADAMRNLDVADPEVEAALKRILMMKLEATSAEMFK